MEIVGLPGEELFQTEVLMKVALILVIVGTVLLSSFSLIACIIIGAKSNDGTLIPPC